MAVLGWIFIRHVFVDWLPPAQIDSYIAGLILLAAAPCTAMVFVWSHLAEGDANFTLPRIMLVVITLVAGTALLMWMGELITQRGIGNGMSLLIFASVVSTLPAAGGQIKA